MVKITETNTILNNKNKTNTVERMLTVISAEEKMLVIKIIIIMNAVISRTINMVIMLMIIMLMIIMAES